MNHTTSNNKNNKEIYKSRLNNFRARINPVYPYIPPILHLANQFQHLSSHQMYAPQLPGDPGLTATGFSGAKTLVTSNSSGMDPEWSQGPLVFAFVLVVLTGLVLPLRLPLIVNGMPRGGKCTCAILARRSMVCRAIKEEDEGMAWKVGKGTEGRTCFWA